MKKICPLVSSFVLPLFVLCGLSYMSCTIRPSAQQLQVLEEQKRTALSAEETVAARQQEKKRLEDELSRIRMELKKAEQARKKN